MARLTDARPERRKVAVVENVFSPFRGADFAILSGLDARF